MNKSSFRRIRNPILTLYFWKLSKYFQLVSLNSEMSYFRRIQSHNLDLILQTKSASVHIGLKQLLSNSFLFAVESQMCIPHFRHLFPLSSQKRSLKTDITSVDSWYEMVLMILVIKSWYKNVSNISSELFFLSETSAGV